MNLYIKFFTLIIKRLFIKKPQTLTQTCISHFRVGLFDLDLNFHMNNGRFFSVMDLGRFDLLMRTGHFHQLIKGGYVPIVLSESMIFKKSLQYLQAYELHTTIESWDKDFFYITQKFVKNNTIIASACVRGCFKKRKKKGIVPVADIFEFLNEEHKEQSLPNLALQQIQLDNHLLPRKNKKSNG